MNEERPAAERGVVSGQAVADFSRLRSPGELAAVSRIENVGMVIVPESLAAAYAAIPASGVGGVVYVPDGANVRVHVGPLVVGGDGLGAADDVLAVVGILAVTSPVTGPVPKQVHVVGSVLAPRGSEPALGAVLGTIVGSVTYYPYAEGQDVKVLTGQTKLSAAMLANAAGQPGDVLLAAGQVLVTGTVTRVGYAQVILTGQVIGPAASRDVLEPRLQVQGQSAWYRTDEPRVIYDDTRVGPEFFRLLDRPVSLVVFGDLAIGPGVTADMVKAKVTDIVLFGKITAPADLVAVLQVLTTEAFGDIRADDGPGH